MSDPMRLFDGAGTDDERRLIGIARADAPPAGAVVRALSALGVAGGVLVPAVSQAAVLGAGANAAGGAAPGASITFVALTKWLAIGVAGGALTMTAVEVVERTSASPPTPARANVSPATVNPTPKAEPANEKKRPVLPAPSNAETRPPAQNPERDSLREELSLLERARRSLAAGRSDEARDILKRHRETFPSGALAEEAEVLRIEVLLARGENALAEQAGRDFLDAHPGSPHAPRVRTLLVRAATDPNRPPRPSLE
jgi:TolA-binding protein